MPDNTQSRPNFLVILTDDQGPWAMPAHTEELIMPTVGELAATGTTFENFYCASPVCSPARASLMTGRMPSAHGVHDWLVGERHPDAHEDQFLGGLHTLPEILDQAGYTCAMAGKWHIGSSQYPAPGFKFWYAHRLGGGPYYGAPIWDENANRTEEPRYFTYACAEEAATFIDSMGRRQAARGLGPGRLTPPTATPPAEAADEPFYLQVNLTAPHSPWINNHPQELWDLYEGCDFPSIERSEPHPWTRRYREDFAACFADPIPNLRGYAAALSGVDRAVEYLLQRLEANGLADNTIVIYMADNGFSCGQHGIWGKGNGTYPLNFWENSVRVPFVVKLPNQDAGRVVNDHVSATSFFPTVCELAGITPPEDPLRAGNSMARLITDPTTGAGDDSVVIYDEYGSGRMIRKDEWKFIDRFEGPIELYNLAEDPGEMHNLAEDGGYQGQLDALRTELRDWFGRHEDAIDSAWGRDIRGRGQVHPPRRGYDDARTYVHEAECNDGDDSRK